METADKVLQGGASFYVDHHLHTGEGDPVDRAQADLFQEPQGQPVDPNAAPATQSLEAEGQHIAAHLPVGLQGQVLAREAGELQLEVGFWAAPYQQWADVMLHLKWDGGENGWVLCGMV